MDPGFGFPCKRDGEGEVRSVSRPLKSAAVEKMTSVRWMNGKG